jgi:hypothetical protein
LSSPESTGSMPVVASPLKMPSASVSTVSCMPYSFSSMLGVSMMRASNRRPNGLIGGTGTPARSR